MKRILGTLLLITAVGLAVEDFEVSFGRGSSESFKIIENPCYVYALRFPQDPKLLPGIFNRALVSSVAQMKKDFAGKANGFYNVRFLWQIVEKELIVVQVCGDAVRRE